MLDGGHFTSAAGIWRRDEDMERQIRFPIPVYLIETATERILIDTGLHPAAAADARRHYDGADSLRFFRLELDAGIDQQVDLGTVTKVVLTHLHFDHAGGLALLPPGVPIFVQRREWEAGHDPAVIARNFYLTRDYWSIADQVVPVDGAHDLLGDAQRSAVDSRMDRGGLGVIGGLQRGDLAADQAPPCLFGVHLAGLEFKQPPLGVVGISRQLA
jgi:glyoxylase-like metal-dependent hydrolase (beta-lactamase superfamily II)